MSAEMNETSKYNDLLNKARLYCNKKETCSYDMKKKLYFWGASDIEQQQIIIQLKLENFINDQRFSMAFVIDKLNINKWGRLKIIYQLRQKNISEEIIQHAVNKIDEKTYTKILKQLIDTKIKTTKAKNYFEFKSKILRYAYTRGFENDLVLKYLENTNSKY